MNKIIGNTTATPNPIPDWNQTDPTKADYIKNKPNITDEESVNSLAYYGDPNIKPTDASYFTFTLDDKTMTASVSASDVEALPNDIVIPHHYTVDDKIYTVTSIAKDGFRADHHYNTTTMQSVIIPNTVTEIGENGFVICDGIKEIKIPDSVTTIGSYGLGELFSLTEITLPKNLKILESYALAYCNQLTTVAIPNSVTTIGDYVFSFCSKLEEVWIPESVTSIGTGLFSVYEGEEDQAPEWVNVFYNGTEEQWEELVGDKDVFGYEYVDIYYLGAATKQYVDYQINDIYYYRENTINPQLEKIGYLGDLTTTEKNTLVSAINELDTDIGDINQTKVDKEILLLKTKEVVSGEAITDAIPQGSEIKVTITGLTPNVDYYIEYCEYNQSNIVDYKDFQVNSKDEIVNFIFTVSDDGIDLPLNRFYINIGGYDYKIEAPIETFTQPFTVEYTCLDNISTVVSNHDSQIGDIDSALDSIIAIQNNLLGVSE